MAETIQIRVAVSLDGQYASNTIQIITKSPTTEAVKAYDCSPSETAAPPPSPASSKSHISPGRKTRTRECSESDSDGSSVILVNQN